MKHLFVPYEIAIKLKEKGFDELCFAIYRDTFDDFGVTLISDGIRMYGSTCQSFYQSNDKYMICVAPLYQQVIDWFEISKLYIIETYYNTDINNMWQYYIIDKRNNYITDNGKQFNSKKEALNKAIEEALKLI